jgi:hypothetical protein
MNRRTFFQRALGGFLAALPLQHGLGGFQSPRFRQGVFDTADFTWYDRNFYLNDLPIDFSKDFIKVVLYKDSGREDDGEIIGEYDIKGVRDAQDQITAPAPMQSIR